MRPGTAAAAVCVLSDVTKRPKWRLSVLACTCQKLCLGLDSIIHIACLYFVEWVRT